MLTAKQYEGISRFTHVFCYASRQVLAPSLAVMAYPYR
jgi:hypothetical protein